MYCENIFHISKQFIQTVKGQNIFWKSKLIKLETDNRQKLQPLRLPAATRKLITFNLVYLYKLHVPILAIGRNRLSTIDFTLFLLYKIVGQLPYN